MSSQLPSPSSSRLLRLPFGRAGLRSETAVVLPLATAMVVLLSIIAVLLFSAALRQLRDAEQEQRLRVSMRHVELHRGPAGGAALGPSTWTVPLGAVDAMVLDASGIALFATSDQQGSNQLLDLSTQQRRRALAGPLAVGPNRQIGPRIAVFVPLDDGTVAKRGSSAPAMVRIDWPAPVLARHLARVPPLAATVILADFALLALVFVYRRRRLQPLEGLIDRARSVAGSDDVEGDSTGEAQHLLATFDQALQELQERRGRDPLSDAIRDSIAASEEDETTTGLLLVDEGGHLLALNEAGARWLGTRIDVAGQPLDKVLAEQPELLAVLDDAIERGETVRRREFPIRSADGDRIIGLTLSKLSRSDGSLRGWLGLFTDLTSVQKENREAMLSQSLAQIAEMSAGLAHELRNGMASLRGYTTLLKRSGLDPEQAADLAELSREIDHLHRVAEDFLSFARPGTARSEPLDLLALAERAANDPALSQTRIEVRLLDLPHERAGQSEDSHTANSSELRGDPQLVERALRNLLHNAARSHRDLSRDDVPIEVLVHLPADANRRSSPEDRGADNSSGSAATPTPEEISTVNEPALSFGPNSGESQLGGQPADSAPRVEVLDRGPGIPPELRDRLFLPFARGNEDGVGLGLALARRIADLHQAELILEDRSGGGTRAVLRFPG